MRSSITTHTNMILIIFLSLTFHNVITTVTPKHTKLALRLIHRDSILSPFRDPKLNSLSSSEDDIRAPVIGMKDGSIFLVNISIGEPPTPQLLGMDTGSQLVWVHCNNNAFDPLKSSTYTNISSYSPQCTNFIHYDHQEKQSQCTYTIKYADQSMSKGILALEKFTFVTSTEGKVEIPNVVFGCSQQAQGISMHDLNGIFGLELAPEKYHFSPNKFSYCIGNISNTEYMHNRLILGDGAILEGDSTPMQTKNNLYMVSLEGISVGDKQISINQDEFHYNVAIDSGTTCILLVKSAYEPLMAEMERLLSGVNLERAIVGNAEDQLCYYGDLERDLKGFPNLMLHLADGADLCLDVEAMFHRSIDGSAFCVAVIEYSENIIGVRAQQYYNVGFDLDAKRVSFQRIDCELLDDQ